MVGMRTAACAFLFVLLLSAGAAFFPLSDISRISPTAIAKDGAGNTYAAGPMGQSIPVQIALQ